MTDMDTAKIEAVEEALERVWSGLEDAACIASYLADDSDEDDDEDDDYKRRARLSEMLADLVVELNGALDNLQIELGRPYLRLMARQC